MNPANPMASSGAMLVSGRRTFLGCVILFWMAITAPRITAQVVLNEILAANQSTISNGTAHPDYIELINLSAQPVQLAGMSLSDDPAFPRAFVFPAGVNLAANARLLIWCDDLFSSPGFHTGFALSANSEQILLYAPGSVTPIDQIRFGPQISDLSIARVPDGTGAWTLAQTTPRDANRAMTPGPPTELRINEWMARPTTGEDWLELHNASDLPVALGGLIFTDRPANPPTNRPIPALSYIGPRSFVQFFASDLARTDANHLDFKLSAEAETIRLLHSDRTTVLDTLTYGPQLTDVSQGRIPDGGNRIISFPAGIETPGAPNRTDFADVVISEVLSHADPPLRMPSSFRTSAATPWTSANGGLAIASINPKNTVSLPALGLPPMVSWSSINSTPTSILSNCTIQPRLPSTFTTRTIPPIFCVRMHPKVRMIPTPASSPTNRSKPSIMRECLVTALLANRDLQIERLNPDIAQASLSLTYGDYDPLFLSEFRKESSSDSGGFDPSDFSRDAIYDAESDIARAGIVGLLPSGLTYSLDAGYANSYGTRNFLNFDSYKVSAGFQLRQPLLKNLWIDETRFSIRIARRDLAISELGLRFITMDVINRVELAYFELAQAQLAMAQSTAAGVRTTVSLAENELRTHLGDSFTNQLQFNLVPLDPLLFVPAYPDLASSWRQGLAHRPDLLQFREEIAKAKINLEYRRNQLFPALDLVGGFGRNGASVAQLPPPLEANASRNEAFSQLRDGTAPSDMIGIAFSLPLSLASERANYRLGKQYRAQAELLLKQKEEFVLQLQDQLVNLQSAAIRAAADYNRALSQLAFADATNLEKNAFQIQSAP